VRVAWLSLLLLAPGLASAEVVESARTVHVTLRYGMALVRTRVELEGDLDRPEEARLTVETPRAAGLVALRLCSAGECRDGRPARALNTYETARTGRRFSPRPVAVALMGRNRGPGGRLHVSVAPLVRGRPVAVEVSYLAPAVEERGELVFTLPALPAFRSSQKSATIPLGVATSGIGSLV